MTLRWHLGQGRSAIPKSTEPQRIAVGGWYGFELIGKSVNAAT